MSRRWAQRIAKLLRKPLFGTTVVPRDARVDPAEFPENEFPVNCAKCGYLMDGLPDGRCPECGVEFDRGRRLVAQYARGDADGRWKHSRARKWARWLVVLGIACSLLPGLLFRLLSDTLQRLGETDPERALDRLIWMIVLLASLKALAALCCLAAGVVTFTHYPRVPKALRRRVLDAIVAGQRDAAVDQAPA